VTIASRDAQLNGVSVREGAFLGLVGGDAVAAGHAFDDVARAVVERLLAEPREILTVLTGEEAPELDGIRSFVDERYPGVELEVQDGGQPHYPLLLFAEAGEPG
jgi:dihydroxyacetone kinase-like predicted kinase